MNQCISKANGHGKTAIKSDVKSEIKAEVNEAVKNGKPSAELLAKEMADSYRTILSHIEDPYREGLLKTPERAAKALMFFTKGYQESVKGKRQQSRDSLEPLMRQLNSRRYKRCGV